MTDFRSADITKQEAYGLLRDWIKLVARHTNPDQDISELLGWLWKLKPATPDPITGLVRCGCGGKAKLVVQIESNYFVRCEKCGFRSGVLVGWEPAKTDTIKAWNTAMGYKEADE